MLYSNYTEKILYPVESKLILTEISSVPLLHIILLIFFSSLSNIVLFRYRFFIDIAFFNV